MTVVVELQPDQHNPETLTVTASDGITADELAGILQTLGLPGLLIPQARMDLIPADGPRSYDLRPAEGPS